MDTILLATLVLASTLQTLVAVLDRRSRERREEHTMFRRMAEQINTIYKRFIINKTFNLEEEN